MKIVIGEAKFQLNPAKWYVHQLYSPTENQITSNCLNPEQNSWLDFCKQSGLHDLFYSPAGGLFVPSNDIVLLFDHHLELIREVRHRLIKVPVRYWDKLWCSVPSVTPEWFVLWLEYRVEYSLHNCRIPAIEYKECLNHDRN